MIYGTEPLLPFDLAEASFLSSDFQTGMSTADLIAARIRQLEKRPEDIQRVAERPGRVPLDESIIRERTVQRRPVRVVPDGDLCSWRHSRGRTGRADSWSSSRDRCATPASDRGVVLCL